MSLKNFTKEKYKLIKKKKKTLPVHYSTKQLWLKKKKKKKKQKSAP